MTAKTPTLYDQEYERLASAPTPELRNIRRALRMMPIRNTARETARLRAVEQLLRARGAMTDYLERPMRNPYRDNESARNGYDPPFAED
jgi:hypothetical protein